jgi:hypothetical protein
MPRNTKDATPYDSLVSHLRELYRRSLDAARAAEEVLREAEAKQKQYILSRAPEVQRQSEPIHEIVEQLKNGPRPVAEVVKAFPTGKSRAVKSSIRAYTLIGLSSKAPKKHPEYALAFVTRDKSGGYVPASPPSTQHDRTGAYPAGLLVALRSSLRQQ